MAPRVNNTLLWELFLQHFPPKVQTVLTPSAGALNLDQLAQQADCILEVSPPTIAANNVDQPNQGSDTTPTQLAAQVVQLTEWLDQLTSQMAQTICQLTCPWCQSRSRSPGDFYRCRIPLSRHNDQPDNGLCYYHQRFSDQAYQCLAPCKWAGKD